MYYTTTEWSKCMHVCTRGGSTTCMCVRIIPFSNRRLRKTVLVLLLYWDALLDQCHPLTLVCPWVPLGRPFMICCFLLIALREDYRQLPVSSTKAVGFNFCSLPSRPCPFTFSAPY